MCVCVCGGGGVVGGVMLCVCEMQKTGRHIKIYIHFIFL